MTEINIATDSYDLEVCGTRIPVTEAIVHIANLDNLSDASLEKLSPAENQVLSALDNWWNNSGKLTAYCTHGHWYSAKAHRFQEGCPFCVAAIKSAETHVAVPVRQSNYIMKAETGSFKMEGHDVDMDVIERHPQVYIESVTEFEDLMNRLEKAEGYDMVHGLHAFEFKENPYVAHMNVLEAFLYVLEERIADDPAGPLQPPHLSNEYFDWAKRRNARLQKPKLSRLD